MTTALVSESVNIKIDEHNTLMGAYESLTPEAQQITHQLINIKQQAITYLSSRPFLNAYLYPREERPGLFRRCHALDVRQDETGAAWVLRRATLPTHLGTDLRIQLVSKLSSEEAESIDYLKRRADERGHLNDQGTDFSKAHIKWKDALVVAGQEDEDQLVSIGFEGIDQSFQLNEHLKRICSGESTIIDGRLLDTELGVVDTELFGLVSDVLQEKT